MGLHDTDESLNAQQAATRIERRDINMCIDEHYAEATDYDREKLIAFANDWAQQIVTEYSLQVNKNTD